MTGSLITSRDPQGIQTIRIVEALYDKLGLEKNAAQRINENPEARKVLTQALKKLSLSDMYESDEVVSELVYSSALKNFDIDRQLVRFAQSKKMEKLETCCHNRRISSEYGNVNGAEWCGAIPDWEKLGETYHQATNVALEMFKTAHGSSFIDRVGPLTHRNFRKKTRNLNTLRSIRADQEYCDFLIVPFQFGMQHRGRSRRRVEELFTSTEFGLGLFEGLMLLLAHPERTTECDLGVDFIGDEYDLRNDPGGRFQGHLRLYREGENLVLTNTSSWYCNEQSAPVSFFFDESCDWYSKIRT